MNIRLFCIISALAIFGITAGCVSVYAQETPSLQTILQEEAIGATDLEIAEPTLLPTSPFYFFKNLTRGVQKFFTFNPVRKIALELKFADEKLAEAKKLAETEPERLEAINRAVENYRRSQEELKARFETLRETSQNPNVEKLLEKVADRAVKHEKLFEELKAKFEDKKELKEKFEATKEKIGEALAEAAKKDEAEKFARKLEKALVETKGSDLKHIRSLEIIDRIQEKVSEELKDKLSDIRHDFSNRLKEDIEDFAKKHKDAERMIKETLEKLPGDTARRLIIIEELQDIAEKRVKDALKGVREILEKVFEEREEIEKRSAEAYKHAEERILKLEEKMKAFGVNVPLAVARLAREARKHLEESRQAFEAKKFGEAFGQARSAEVLARNALRMLEEVKEPEDEDLKEDILEIEKRLRGWEQRIEKLPEELRPKAKEVLENARFHLRRAAETLAKGDLRGAKKHFEEAKSFERLLERIFKELFRKHEDQKSRDAAAPAPAAPPAEFRKEPLSRCQELEKNLSELKNMFHEGRVAKEDFDRKYEVLYKEWQACLGVQPTSTPKPITEPVPTPTKPEEQVVCPQIYDPVCGVNGKTYSNSCFAKVAGVEIKYRGECGKPLEEPTAIKPAPTTAAEPTPTTVAPVLMELKVEADDNGFYPSEAIAVAKGSKVKLHFIVRSTNVYFGGLDFRSPKFKTDSVKPGGSTAAEFTADESFVITSYWPASGVRKADLKVEVR